MIRKIGADDGNKKSLITNRIKPLTTTGLEKVHFPPLKRDKFMKNEGEKNR